MPEIFEQGSVDSGAAMSWLELEHQIEQAQEQVNKQRDTIAQLMAQGHEVTAARKQLISMLENLAFLKKLCCA
jgi:hypothetical protein